VSSRSHSVTARSARELNARILRHAARRSEFSGSTTPRKGHGQSITAFRFANGCSSRSGAASRIDHVQITARDRGRRARGNSTTVTGAFARHGPNHVFSLLSLVAMNRRVASTTLRSAPRRPMSSPQWPAIKPERAVRGQYWVRHVLGQTVRLRTEPMLLRIQTSKTYAAMASRDRQLALGRRSLLHPHRQASVATTHRDRNLPFKQAPYAASRTRPSTLCRPIGWY